MKLSFERELAKNVEKAPWSTAAVTQNSSVVI